MKCKLEELTINEIPVVQELADKIWKTTYPSIISLQQIEFMLNMMYSKEKIEENLIENHNWYLINFQEKNIGFTHFYQKEDSIFLSKLYVLETYQKSGIGKEVLYFIIDKAMELKVSKIQLRVNKENVKAINAYKKYGFIIANEDIFQLNEEYIMDDYIMELIF